MSSYLLLKTPKVSKAPCQITWAPDILTGMECST